jgi:hypothetical protein
VLGSHTLKFARRNSTDNAEYRGVTTTEKPPGAPNAPPASGVGRVCSYPACDTQWKPGFANNGTGLSGWFNSNGPGLLGGSGFQNFGGLISGFNSLGSGVSGFADTGDLDLVASSFVSGIADIGHNLSGLFFRGAT